MTRRTLPTDTALPHPRPETRPVPAAFERRTVLRAPALAALAAGAAGVAGSLGAQGLTNAAAAAENRQIAFRHWMNRRWLSEGTTQGLTFDGAGRLVIASSGWTRTTHEGRRYAGGTWHSPWVTESFAFTELIASWKATTPDDSFVVVKVAGRDGSGRTSSWDTLAYWAAGDLKVSRRSYGPQSDDLAKVSVDTWQSHSSAGLRAYQLRVSLYRLAGANTPSPALSAVGAMTSRLPSTWSPSSHKGVVRTLDVPGYSQMIHTGHYPSFGGGGEAWCSPTSVSMVLGYYRRLPSAKSYAWVPSGHPVPWVDHAARMTYDHTYKGCGNWSFSAAYASQLVDTAYVTRLRSLREAEEFIAQGIPLVASIRFGRGQLTGAPISASNGHLLVIVGFDRSGNVVVNDPAAPKAASVRRTYRRAEFERAWLPTSGGLVYVIHDAAHTPPSRAGRSNW
ncbi:C39 family peptidase [Nocardioides zeae]|uniref:C39 family peptidase n=1 Tax=Nocardioides imazamoxiresistens TaxID=3231893 RepID=A0ABU3PZ62_9ACTN|nr:C39 family peptidase [Nocardioides zeae]MDT9594171.1 C39 family peptidase [Nocardioides zeae]